MMSALERGTSVAVIEDPICEICKEPMEPIPPLGWVCLSQHAAGEDGGPCGD